MQPGGAQTQMAGMPQMSQQQAPTQRADTGPLYAARRGQRMGGGQEASSFAGWRPRRPFV